jgi:antitoxin HicB
MKSIEEYLSLPYHFELIPDEDEEARTGWVIAVEELPGCISQGKTPNQAMDNIRDAMAGWLSVAIEDGHEIPEPRPEPSYSGRFVVRLPTGLHAALAIEAEREGVSLNQLVTAVLAGAVRWSGAPETDGSTASYAERTSTRRSVRPRVHWTAPAGRPSAEPRPWTVGRLEPRRTRITLRSAHF